jgi:L-ascorbate metabolism protein UlaG (beta-lactamase superfamily)
MMKALRAALYCGLIASFITPATAFAQSLPDSGKTQITWYGNAAFKITTPAGHVLLVDPWITNNRNENGKADLAALDKVDLILISHAHFDHVGNAVAIARRTGARLVSTYDLGSALVAYAGYPAKDVSVESQGTFGGELSFFDGEVRITLVPAVHTSGLEVPRGDNTPPAVEYGGNPSGFLITVRGGPTIYHTGDTDVFGDMKLIPLHHHVDVMLACIGDHFTMGPEGAALAVELVQPDVVIPMHFKGLPGFTGTPEAFRAALQKRHSKARMMLLAVHQTVEF